MPLNSRLHRLEGSPTLARRRAQARPRTDAPPTLFERWFALVRLAQFAPDRIADPAVAQTATDAGLAIAVQFYEEGAAALRAGLAGQTYVDGEPPFTEEQIAVVVAWCQAEWGKLGSSYDHPLGPWASHDWRHVKTAATAAQRTEWKHRAQAFRQSFDQRNPPTGRSAAE